VPYTAAPLSGNCFAFSAAVPLNVANESIPLAHPITIGGSVVHKLTCGIAVPDLGIVYSALNTTLTFPAQSDVACHMIVTLVPPTTKAPATGTPTTTAPTTGTPTTETPKTTTPTTTAVPKTTAAPAATKAAGALDDATEYAVAFTMRLAADATVVIDTTKQPGSCLTKTAVLGPVVLHATPTDVTCYPTNAALVGSVTGDLALVDLLLPTVVEMIIKKTILPALHKHSVAPSLPVPNRTATMADIRHNVVFAALTDVFTGAGLRGLVFDVAYGPAESNSLRIAISAAERIVVDKIPGFRLVLPKGMTFGLDVLLKNFTCDAKSCRAGQGLFVMNVRIGHGGDIDGLIDNLVAGPVEKAINAKLGGKPLGGLPANAPPLTPSPPAVLPPGGEAPSCPALTSKGPVPFKLLIAIATATLIDKVEALGYTFTDVTCPTLDLPDIDTDYGPTKLSIKLSEDNVRGRGVPTFIQCHAGIAGAGYSGKLTLTVEFAAGQGVWLAMTQVPNSCLTQKATLEKITLSPAMSVALSPHNVAAHAALAPVVGAVQFFAEPLVRTLIDLVIAPAFARHALAPTVALPAALPGTVSIRNNVAMIGLMSTFSQSLHIRGVTTAAAIIADNAAHFSMTFPLGYPSPGVLPDPAFDMYLPPGTAMDFDVVFVGFRCNATACLVHGGIDILNLRLSGAGELDLLVDNIFGLLLNTLVRGALKATLASTAFGAETVPPQAPPPPPPPPPPSANWLVANETLAIFLGVLLCVGAAIAARQGKQRWDRHKEELEDDLLGDEDSDDEGRIY
jgi:hypothetical protein